MKLNLLLAAACVGVVAFGSGCSSGPVAQPAKTASSDRVVAESAPESAHAVAITQLMSAQLPGPTPKVGKARLANDDDSTGVTDSSSASDSDADGEGAPKSVRRSDGSRRHGGFGTTK